MGKGLNSGLSLIYLIWPIAKPWWIGKRKKGFRTVSRKVYILLLGLIKHLKMNSYHDSYAVLCCALLSHVLTLRDPMDYRPPGSSVHGDSPYKNTGEGCHAILQRIFPTQGSKPCLWCLLHFTQILYCSATKETWYAAYSDVNTRICFLRHLINCLYGQK